jgi:hypothetical protein
MSHSWVICIIAVAGPLTEQAREGYRVCKNHGLLKAVNDVGQGAPETEGHTILVLQDFPQQSWGDAD